MSFQQTFEAKRSNHLAELQGKEDEMRQMFVLRVKEKESELKENEKEVNLSNTHCNYSNNMTSFLFHSYDSCTPSLTN